LVWQIKISLTSFHYARYIHGFHKKTWHIWEIVNYNINLLLKYPFAGKLVLITSKEIEKAKKDYKELLKLRQKIFA